VTVLEGGGHIAEIFDKRAGVSPLWIPSWPSIEPTAFDSARHQEFGGSDAERRLLVSLMGHNLCLDIFGGPSAEEEAAGFVVHGEASVATYWFDVKRTSLVMHTTLPIAKLRVERHLELHESVVFIREIVENLSATDRPIGWTQHATIGPPFLERGVTELRASATRSKVFDGTFGPADYLMSGAEFDWPMAPAVGGGHVDLRRCSRPAPSSAYTAHLMNPEQSLGYCLAYSPRFQLAFGYVWRPSDFPWLGIWEENASRAASPWHGRELTRGLEFGVSPFPETRRQMIDRGQLFGVPTYRWIPARTTVSVEYCAVLQQAAVVPDVLAWP
jgi:hypothetical protein